MIQTKGKEVYAPLFLVLKIKTFDIRKYFSERGCESNLYQNV